MTKIILASASPRRKEILQKAGFEFDVVVPDIDENHHIGRTCVKKTAKKIAFEKAVNVKSKINESVVIIAADTLVYKKGRILGKPSSRSDAYDMIRLLSGGGHSVITGYCVLIDKTKYVCGAVRTKVHFRKISQDEIKEYVDTDEPYDKAGAYGIQGKASVFVDKIIGCYFNVMGLPVSKIFSILKKYEQLKDNKL